jgi:hypothetical protein
MTDVINQGMLICTLIASAAVIASALHWLGRQRRIPLKTHARWRSSSCAGSD